MLPGDLVWGFCLALEILALLWLHFAHTFVTQHFLATWCPRMTKNCSLSYLHSQRLSPLKQSNEHIFFSVIWFSLPECFLKKVVSHVTSAKQLVWVWCLAIPVFLVFSVYLGLSVKPHSLDSFLPFFHKTKTNPFLLLDEEIIFMVYWKSSFCLEVLVFGQELERSMLTQKSLLDWFRFYNVIECDKKVSSVSLKKLICVSFDADLLLRYWAKRMVGLWEKKEEGRRDWNREN